MSQMTLQTLVGTALTDREFRHGFLNGRRPTLLTKFDLTEEEREVVLGIKAESLQEFAAQLCKLLKFQEGLISYSPMAMAMPYPSLRPPVGSTFRQENLAPRPLAW